MRTPAVRTTKSSADLFKTDMGFVAVTATSRVGGSQGCRHDELKWRPDAQKSSKFAHMVSVYCGTFQLW